MPSGPVVSVGRGSSGPAETAGRPTGHGTGQGAAVRGHEAPAPPASQARFAMLPAAIPADAAVQPPEAPREARPPPPPAPPPRGPLLRDPRRGRLPGVWNAEASDARVRRLGLVRGRLDPAVGGQPLGRSAHARRLGGTTVWPRGEIWARLSQDAGAAEKAPCHQPAQEHLHRRRGPPARRGERRTAPQVGVDPRNEDIVVQPPVARGEDGLHRQTKGGHEGNQVQRRLAGASHRAFAC